MSTTWQKVESKHITIFTNAFTHVEVAASALVHMHNSIDTEGMTTNLGIAT